MIVLVTGGAGFIGSHLVQHFQGRATVRVLDSLRTGRRANLDGLQCEFIEGSIQDAGLVAAAMDGVDYVFHLAALVSVPESMARPRDCLAINGEGLLIVLEAAARAKVKKLCFSSSAAVYGDNPISPKTEDLCPAPISPYGVTKLDGEYYCGIFAREGWLPTVCLRYFNVFGPRQDPKSPYAAAVAVFADRAARGQDVTIHGDGTQTRDFVFVKDVVAANAYLAQRPEGGVFNVACGQGTSIRALADQIIALTGSSSRVVHGPSRAGDIKHSLARVDKLLATGFRPAWTVAAGLREMLTPTAKPA